MFQAQFLSLFLESSQLLLFSSQPFTELGRGLLRFQQLCLVLGFAGQFLLHLRQRGRDFPQFGLFVPRPVLGPLLESVAMVQTQYVAQNAFSLSGGIRGELVGPILQQEGGVGEGFVVHTQSLADGGLGLPQRISGEGTKLAVVGDLEVQARVPPGSVLLSLTNDAVVVPGHEEFEGDLHVRRAQVNQIVVTLSSCLAPQSPGHSVHEGRLAVTVVTCETRQVDPREIKRRRLLAIAHEVAHLQLQRNHGQLLPSRHVGGGSQSASLIIAPRHPTLNLGGRQHPSGSQI